MTTFADEQTKQKRWRTEVPQKQATFDAMLANEFRSADELRAWQRSALQNVVAFVARQTRYYRELFACLGLHPSDLSEVEHLPRLPILRKHEVFEHEAELWPEVLPPGEQRHGPTHSSGTTGRSVSVQHCTSSLLMFSLLWQRQARWFDLDPNGIFLDVRIGSEVSCDAEGKPNPDGVVIQRARWPHLGSFFRTGPQLGFNLSNPIAQQVAWLQSLRPTYAMSYPGLMEEWMLTAGGSKPVDSLRCLIGIGSHVTPSLRARLESTYGIPLHQTYGLNEMGKVALRCEAGRYHVHSEHSLVEIVHPDGKPCEPGQTGHILVTSLRNWAMPLLRYDTGDLAEVVNGPCPCGRTLPSFGEVIGRYRRYAGLPDGTRERVNVLLSAFGQMATADLAFLRRYQLYQRRDNQFELRLETTAPVSEAFRRHIEQTWAKLDPKGSTPLTICEVDQIPPAPSGKLLDFQSEFYADPQVNAPAQGRVDANG